MFSKTVERCIARAIGERGELDDPHVDANVVSCWYGNIHVAFGLNGHVPLVVRATDRDVLDRSQHLPTVAITHPAELGQEDAPVVLIQFDLLGFGITEGVPASTFLASGQLRALGEEMGVGAIQVLELLLQRL